MALVAGAVRAISGKLLVCVGDLDVEQLPVEPAAQRDRRGGCRPRTILRYRHGNSLNGRVLQQPLEPKPRSRDEVDRVTFARSAAACSIDEWDNRAWSGLGVGLQ